MIPDFLAPVSVGGRCEHVVCRDVPAAVFFRGYPRVDPSAATYMAERETWVETFLARVIVRPILSPEAIHRLDTAARLDLERRYMAAVGIGAGPPVEWFYVGPALPMPSSWAVALACPPQADFVGAVRAQADRFHVLPAAVWLQPVSEYLLSQAIVLAERGPSGGAGLSPLEGEVGMEGG